MIAPHQARRKKLTQDGRPLRRYKRRWKVERFFAWLGKYKRIITRWDKRLDHYNNLVYLGCIFILLRKYL
jgi:transposase